MKPMSTREVEALLLSHGFVLLRIAKHMIYGKDEKRIAIPRSRVVSPGVMRSVNKVLGVSNG